AWLDVRVTDGGQPFLLESAATVESQFCEEEKLGAMKKVKAQDALPEFETGLNIASLAALEKENKSYRVAGIGG
ncbi:unnamed protein product, partial [Effrenium voratum]